ncbi:PREDICTED: uncharacterized protein LOC106108014 isoform X3 [Papilio polytes]|uniref:uncharacterized protein LOC106108014 isoform X3 n=1 Tax=Papilio polytes TaxID=76194 RepID=UPI0006763CCA|nr:PREDICTED: uncharacterized protein LOC106108014 isoform X3 [Papilio polytes]
MATQNRPYQGYPYVNPVVIDVPSIDPTTAGRWTNLPRRPIGGLNDRPGTSSDVNEVRAEADTKDSSESNSNGPEDNPVVYIDVPESGASSVLESPTNRNETEGSFVQDTILYDPFKNRRIELRVTGDESDDENSRQPTSSSRGEQSSRPQPPNTLQISSPGSSSGYTSSPTFGSSTNPNLPGLMSKEAGYYGRQTPDDMFPLGPIPVSEFPEPPPAYTEFDRVNQTESVTETTPPRTEVVTIDNRTTVRPGSDRKLLQCPHCNQRVHSLVVREVGAFTHILAIIFSLLCLIPIVILIYCTDSCKYKNHYCPNCNQLIGYEIPILCQQMAFV